MKRDSQRELGRTMRLSIMVLLLAFIFAAVATGADEELSPISPERLQLAAKAFDQLKTDFPAVRAHKSGQLTTRLYGTVFGTGSSPLEVAEQFRQTRASVLGAEPQDIVLGKKDNRSLTEQGVMYNQETGTYKFTLVYYTHERQGIPVFDSELKLLMRNEPGYPLVWAGSSLRDLGNFTADRSMVGTHSSFALEAARADESGLTDFTEQETVVWAGVNAIAATPRMAVKFIGSSDFPEIYLFIVDPNTGEILHKENLIIFEDVTGNVAGMATPGPKAMQCTDEVSTVFPWAEVSIIGGSSAYADANGNFTIPNGGTSPVSVVSGLSGQYFYVENYAGSEDVDTIIVTPPGPVNFLHHALSTSGLVRAQMNG